MRGRDQPRDVVRDAARQVHLRRRARTDPSRSRGRQHRLQRRRLAVHARGQDLFEHRPIDAGDVDLEHEAIELRFGQRIRALELDRVLRRQHEERRRQRPRLAERRHAPFLHRFEQRRLRLRRRAVDFVGQQQVGEDRAGVEDELLSCPRCSWRMWLPVMSVGSRSGVNWMRRTSSDSSRDSALTSSVLPRPGSPSSSTWPRASSAVTTSSITCSLPRITRRSSSTTPRDLRLAVGDTCRDRAVNGRQCSQWLTCRLAKYFFTAL